MQLTETTCAVDFLGAAVLFTLFRRRFAISAGRDTSLRTWSTGSALITRTCRTTPFVHTCNTDRHTHTHTCRTASCYVPKKGLVAVPRHRDLSPMRRQWHNARFSEPRCSTARHCIIHTLFTVPYSTRWRGCTVCRTALHVSDLDSFSTPLQQTLYCISFTVIELR